jgi:hypothetical protein
MDAVDRCAATVRLHRVQKVLPGARELVRILRESAEQVREALGSLDGDGNVAVRIVEMNRLEDQADRAHQRAVERLLEEEYAPLVVIRWKEILDCLEDATERCRDVATVLEGVLVKRS